MAGAEFAELTPTESGEFFDNSTDKKKKRRSRRTKQNSTSPVDSPVSKITLGRVQSPRGSVDHRLPGVSNGDFSSPPDTVIDKERLEFENESLQNQHMLVSNANVRLPFNSRADNLGCRVLEQSNMERGTLLHLRSNGVTKRNIFAPHWPEDAVSKALETGEVFKASFNVNAFNNLEAYCKIDGLPTDVLINGLVAQNRAIQGDIVAIKVDPPSLWMKMKGFNGTVERPASVINDILQKKTADMALDDPKGKGKIEVEYNSGGNSPMNGYCNGDIVIGTCSRSNGVLSCSSGGDEAVNAMEKLCATVSSFPSKRPTGRVVHILEMSPRRARVVGFLSSVQLNHGSEGNRKDLKKIKNGLSALSHDYVMLSPTEAKFPKMVVPLRSLPICLKNSLEAGDATVEMELVAARIVGWGKESSIPEAEVMHSFGRGRDLEAHIAAILFGNSINASNFSPEVLSCLPPDPWEVPPQELEKREDLRNLCVFTIDPSTATDLDDALSVETLPNGTFRVGVHIADVSYFVKPDTALDSDAQIRSTCVYMLQRKLPMLPPRLSENFGSLRAGVDRLAFSMFWDIDTAGEVLNRWICRTVINSCCKLSYEHAEDMINGIFDAEGTDSAVKHKPALYGSFEWSDVLGCVKSLHKISRILKAKRFSDGALSLTSPKVAFIFDEDGIPYDSLMCGMKESNFLIEEFMLLANITAAEVMTRTYPSSALLRRHPEPNMRKLREFEDFCKRNGFKLDISSSAKFHHSLECIRSELGNDSVMFDILMMYATRPMQLATYFCTGDSTDASDWGHYALAIPLYTHFTSPLRRYPDILVHRMLAATVEAEEMYMKNKAAECKMNTKEAMNLRCFTGIGCVKEIVESSEAQELLSAAGSKYKVPCTEVVSDIASHCNERKLAARYVKDATDKLYMWTLIRKKELLCVEARVMALGPRFMSIYIPKLAVERRIHYDEVDGLNAEWLDGTSTLVLSRYTSKHCGRRGSPGKFRRLEEVAFVISPTDDYDCHNGTGDVAPALFPLTIGLLSTISVALNAIGGDDGPVEIGVRLYVSSYL